jgi:hypothetical protein
MSQTPFEPPGSTPAGAARVAGAPPARRTWLLPLLLGLLALIALLLLLSRCGGDDPRPAATPLPSATLSTPSVSSSPGATVTPSTTASVSVSGSAGASGAAGGEAGTVVAGGDAVLGGGSARQLGDYHDQQAVGRAVRVQSVPADEGFWVGTSTTDRIWVQLTGTRGESDYKVKQGDAIDFTGTVTAAAAGFAEKAGVTAAEGAAQLTQQGHYVAVPSSTVKLAS